MLDDPTGREGKALCLLLVGEGFGPSGWEKDNKALGFDFFLFFEYKKCGPGRLFLTRRAPIETSLIISYMENKSSWKSETLWQQRRFVSQVQPAFLSARRYMGATPTCSHR